MSDDEQRPDKQRYGGDKARKDDAVKPPDSEPATPPADDEAPPAAFPAVTPGDDVGEPVDPAARPSPLTVTDDGRGVVIDPEQARQHLVVVPASEISGDIAAFGADGREYVANFRPNGGPDGGGPGGGEVRWAVSVIETKVPYDQRPTRGILDTPEQIADRRYEAVWRPLSDGGQLGAPDAPDDDPVHGVGVASWWRAYLTEAEVATLRAAPYVESVTYAHKVGPVGSEWSARFTGSDFDGPAWRAREARRAGGEQR